MTNPTSTLRYTTITRVPNPVADMIHAVAAAADRAFVREANAGYAARVIARLTDEGAVKVGMKVCHDDGWKERCVFMIDDPACAARITATAGMDAEVWGILADGTYSDEVF